MGQNARDGRDRAGRVRYRSPRTRTWQNHPTRIVPESTGSTARAPGRRYAELGDGRVDGQRGGRGHRTRGADRVSGHRTLADRGGRARLRSAGRCRLDRDEGLDRYGRRRRRKRSGRVRGRGFIRERTLRTAIDGGLDSLLERERRALSY